MKHSGIVIRSYLSWRMTVVAALVLLLAACGTKAPVPEQSNTEISQKEAEAAVLKLQGNAGIEAASTEDFAALSDEQLTGAWSRLSEREQKAAKLFLDANEEEVGSSSVEAGVSGGDLNAQDAGCWYYTKWVYGKNIFGKKLWQFNQRLNWCSNGSIITSSNREVWGETFWIGWRYKGEKGRWRSGGTGYTYCRATVQGDFELATGPWDVQHSYPRIESTIYR